MTASGPPGRTMVQVMIPLPLPGAYDYEVPDGLELAVGDFVRVPLGGRHVNGVVWADSDPDSQASVEPGRLKPVLERLDVPAMTAPLRRFVTWVADYTLSPPGSVLRMVMSVPAALAPPKPKTVYALDGPAPERMTPARRRVMEVLTGGPPRGLADLTRQAAVGGSVVRGLVEAGTVRALDVPDRPAFKPPDWRREGPLLSPDQAAAAARLWDTQERGGFKVTVIDGVTGAGKTEVYFEAIAATLKTGGQVLVLLPEIGLSAQWLDRFTARFGAAPAEWHSDLGQARRRKTWRAVAEGRAAVVVGARSALFLPFGNLRLIIVDEEHDTSYKQEDGVIYNARDMAIVRASIGEFAAILVSATPSLETITNMKQGRYAVCHLPDRHGGAALPDIKAIDMRREDTGRRQWISPTLTAAVDHCLNAGEQALLFLNRRGYAPVTVCRACGSRLECPNCSAWLVDHRLARRLQCHHCGYQLTPPKVCPSCEAEDSLVACGPGVERLAEEAEQKFPSARIGIFTSDTLTGPAAAADFVSRVERREVDLLIGTQVLAKGHHFPLLTLVGVIDADLGLGGGDLRAAERTYQLLQQVAGRAGRAHRPGQVLLQTYMADHEVMQALISGDRDRFLDSESAARQRHAMPPFGRLAALIVSGPEEGVVADVARELGRLAPRGPDIQVFGPAPAPLALLRGRYRQRLLLKAGRPVDVPRTIRRWLKTVKTPRKVRIQVDIDPYSFL